MKSNILGDNIRRYRSFKGLKQQVLADEIGVHRITLSRYENGNCSIPTSKLLLIIEKLEIDFNDLFIGFSGAMLSEEDGLLY
jgi:transcriptional regulator with XRE-family HTH domain